MMVQIPAPHWNVFKNMTIAQFTKSLRELARNIDLSRYPKSKRGPKKPPPTVAATTTAGMSRRSESSPRGKPENDTLEACPVGVGRAKWGTLVSADQKVGSRADVVGYLYSVVPTS